MLVATRNRLKVESSWTNLDVEPNVLCTRNYMNISNIASAIKLKLLTTGMSPAIFARSHSGNRAFTDRHMQNLR